MARFRLLSADVGANQPETTTSSFAACYMRCGQVTPWRDMHERYGKWNSVHIRFCRWAEQGV
ncbi:transposase [Gluconobacter sp. Dm-62]|nr:transposase [Gluconobacter sp. Dm-62]